jgi:hypothetical protein
MHVTCLYFPRLALELAWRKRPALRSRPVVLLDGAGVTALVTARSPEAADSGVLAGMQAGQARWLCPAAAFVPGDMRAARELMAQVAAGLLDRGLAIAAEARDDHVFVYRGAVASIDHDWLAEIAGRLTGFPVRVVTAGSAAEALSLARLGRRATRAVAASAAGGRRPLRRAPHAEPLMPAPA